MKLPRTTTRPAAGRCSRTRRSGAILLECLLALALLIAAGITVMACLDRASSSVSFRADEARASQIAASAMAMIDAGIMTPDTVQGPVDKWRTGAAGEGQWHVSVETQPTEFGSLVAVCVRVYRGEQTSGPPLATLHQLVDLSPATSSLSAGGTP